MSTSRVFITGATGFIGSHVVASTLRAGYQVRLSIRKAEQEAVLRALYPDHSSEIETVVIPDLSQPEAFSNALNDIDYIFHLASPMPGRGVDIHQDYINPAVQATTSILEAAKGFENIKKVVIVSSVLALTPVNALISNDVTVKDNTGESIPVDLSMTFPDDFIGHALKYSISKIKAHEATRDFIKNNKTHYSVVTLHPVFVLGDSLIQNTAEEIGGMNAIFWMSLFSEKPKLANAWVHVRDVADAHVKVLEVDVESGKEFILSRPVVSWSDITSHVNKKYPALGSKLEGPFEGSWSVDTTVADRILGVKWRSEYEIVDDVIEQQLALRGNTSSI